MKSESNDELTDIPLHTLEGGYEFELESDMIGEELIPINASLLYRDPNNNHKPALLTTDYSLDLHLAALNFNPETI